MKKIYLILSFVGVFILLAILLFKMAMEISPLFTDRVGLLLFLYATTAAWGGYIFCMLDNWKKEKKRKK